NSANIPNHDVVSHDNIATLRLYVLRHHLIHEARGILQWRAVHKVVVIAKRRRPRSKDTNKEQNRNSSWKFHRMTARRRCRVSSILRLYSENPERPIIANVNFLPYSTPG